LNTQEPRSKPPSLLADDEASDASSRITLESDASSLQSETPIRRRRLIIIAIGIAAVAFAVLGVGGAFRGSSPSPSQTLPVSAESLVASNAAVDGGVAAGDAPKARNALPAGETDGLGEVDGVATIVAEEPGSPFESLPQASTEVSNPTVAASNLPRPTLPKAPLIKRATPHARADATTAVDADADLLAVMLEHLDRKPVPTKAAKKRASRGSNTLAGTALLPQDCPPANTEAGVTCRQRFCAAHIGEDVVNCPTAASETP